MTTAGATYVLEQRSGEIARLIAYAEREAEDVRLVCRRCSLKTGSRAIDIGCGPLGALATLSEVVGDCGEVVGLDASSEALTKAASLVDSLSLRNVRLLQGDLSTIDSDAMGIRGRFDLAYCRLVLLHQRSPAAFLDRVVRLVRPGGFIVYQDIVDDTRYPDCDPPVAAQTRAWQLILALFARRSLSPGVARDHAQLAQSANCELVHQRGKFGVLPPAQGFEIVQQLLGASRSQLVETGLVAGPSEVDALIADLENAKASTYRFWHGPLAVETIVRTPQL